MRPPQRHLFIRKPVEGSEYLLIESKCAQCGFRIVGSVSKTLQQDESNHVKDCPKERLRKKRRMLP